MNINIKIFNDILDQFFEFLETEFLDFQSDILITKTSISIIRKGNPKLIIEQFKEIISPYTQQIFDCDEDFFINFEKNISLDKNNLLTGLKLKHFFINNKNIQKIQHQKAMLFFYFQKLLSYANLIY